MYKNIKVIAFDADDTLWVNETYFREAEHQFAKLLAKYETENKIDQELFRKEIENLTYYGYGIKGFILSMIECALELSNYKINPKTIEAILNIGKKIFVACGNKTTLEILEVQKPGKNIISASAYLNGIKLSVGDKFGI